MVQRILPNGSSITVNGSTNPSDAFTLTSNNENAVFDKIVSQALQLGGAPLNYYKLLGITARNTPQNLTGFGSAIGSAHIPGFPPFKVFDPHGSFRSAARGSEVTSSAYVGYDFGVIAMPDGTKRNGLEKYSNRIVSQLIINQSICVEWTASKLRIERSDDGIKWFGVAIIDDVTPGLGTYNFANSSASRFWRIRPIEFRGAATNEFWEVTSLLFSESGNPELSNIEDEILFENRSREYQIPPLPMKGRFDHQDAMMEVMMHGMSLSQQLMIEVSFSAAVALLGRPPIIGDIIELPSEIMYDSELKAVRKFVEVMDVAWSTTSYTPGWMPTMLRLSTSPAIASRETRQIFGSSAKKQFDPAGMWDIAGAVEGAESQDYTGIAETIRKEAKKEMPQRGIDQSESGQPSLDEQQKAANVSGGKEAISQALKPQTGFYVEDAMPPDNEPYSEGPALPKMGEDGAYHRLTYTGAAKDVPARLYRYSATKARWIYMETDRRGLFDPLTPMNKPWTKL